MGECVRAGRRDGHRRRHGIRGAARPGWPFASSWLAAPPLSRRRPCRDRPAAAVICLVTNRRALSPDARTVRDEVRRLEGNWTRRSPRASIWCRSGSATCRPQGSAIWSKRVASRAAATDASHRERPRGRRRGRAVRKACTCGRRPAQRPRACARWAARLVVGRSIHSAESAVGGDADYLCSGPSSERRRRWSAGRGPRSHWPTAASRHSRACAGHRRQSPRERAAACRAAGAAGMAAIGVFLPPGRSRGCSGAGGGRRRVARRTGRDPKRVTNTRPELQLRRPHE